MIWGFLIAAVSFGLSAWACQVTHDRLLRDVIEGRLNITMGEPFYGVSYQIGLTFVLGWIFAVLAAVFICLTFSMFGASHSV